MTLKNGNWKVAASILAAAVSVFVILGYVSGGVDEKIDVKIEVHEAQTEIVHQQNINEIKTDIAVIKVQQKQATKDIGEIKELIKDGQ